MPREMMEYGTYKRRPLPTARDLVAVLFRQRWIVLGAFLAVILLVFLSGLWTRKYQAQMKILVLRQRMDAAVTAQPNAPPEATPEVTEQDLNSEAQLLRSDDLLRNVVLETGLENQSRSVFGHQDDDVAIDSAVRNLNKNLKVDPIANTNVISVAYASSNPELSAKVLKAVEAAYIKKQQEVNHPSGEFTFFEQQTDRYHQGLELAQQQLATFTRKTGVVSAETERQLTLQQASDFEAAAHQAHASASDIRWRIRALEAELRRMQPRVTTEITTGPNPELMQQLKSTLLNLELKRTELLTKFDPGYRLVQEVDEQIAETRRAITAADGAPPRKTTTDRDPTYQMLRSDLAKARSDLAGMDALALADRVTAHRYLRTAQQLERDGLEQADLQLNVTTQENNYLLYLKKREEARISNALDERGILNVAVIEQPIVPALPVRSEAGIVGLTFLLGLFVSIGTGYAADYASPSFRTPDEVIAYLDMPVLGCLPKGKA